MKRLFLKFRLLVVVGLTAAILSSCKKDDNDPKDASKITATDVIDSSSEIVKVKASAYWVSGDDWGDESIAEANYENNGFTLQLPSSLDKKFLMPFDDDDIEEGFTVSDKQAQTLFLDDIDAFDRDDEEIGYFYLKEITTNASHYTSWIYADRNVTVKGETSENYDGMVYINKIDVNLKKGWNVVYDSFIDTADSETYSITTQKPSGVNYMWYYTSYYGKSSPEKPWTSIFKENR